MNNAPFLSHGLAAILLTIGMTSLRAEESPPLAPPEAPFIHNTAANAVWTVDFKRPESDKPKAANSADPSLLQQRAFLKRTEITKFGATRREIDTWSDGTKIERWYSQGFHLFEQKGSPDVYVVVSSGADVQRFAYPDYRKNDFPNLEWLSAKTYVGASTFQGRQAYLFEKAAQLSVLAVQPVAKSASEQATAAEAPPKVRAWIDPATRLPLGIFDPTGTAVYSYQDTAGAPPEMPARFAKALQEYKDANAVPGVK